MLSGAQGVSGCDGEWWESRQMMGDGVSVSWCSLVVILGSGWFMSMFWLLVAGPSHSLIIACCASNCYSWEAVGGEYWTDSVRVGGSEWLKLALFS